MKKKTINKLIQKPLRFHHQDIHEEMDDIKSMILDVKGMIVDVKNQMQELQQRIGDDQQTSSVWLSEYDDHSWG